jgi:hypothetical protein
LVFEGLVDGGGFFLFGGFDVAEGFGDVFGRRFGVVDFDVEDHHADVVGLQALVEHVFDVGLDLNFAVVRTSSMSRVPTTERTAL